MTVRLNAKPVNITLCQVYAPTSAADDDEIENFYDTLQDILDSVPSQDIKIVMGDFSAKVGSDVQLKGIVGEHGLGECNERGVKLIDFCASNALTVANSMFLHHPRRKYTWLSPDGNTRNQIDYILINSRWQSSIINARTFPGADCGSDHQLLVALLRLRLKNIRKSTDTVTRFDLENLSSGQYTVAVENRFSALSSESEELTPEERWEKVKHIILDSAQQTLGVKKCNAKHRWIQQDTLDMIEQRRKVKVDRSMHSDQYKEMSKQIKHAVKRDKEAFLNQQCEQLEADAKRGNSRGLFQTVRNITSRFQRRRQCCACWPLGKR